MSANVILLRTGDEETALDTSCILTLRKSVGDQRCRQIVDEVVFHLSDKLSQLNTALQSGEIAAMEAVASGLAGLSGQIGLTVFSRVARDLRGCIETGDRTATFAVAARLVRIGEEALLSVTLHAESSAL